MPPDTFTVAVPVHGLLFEQVVDAVKVITDWLTVAVFTNVEEQ
jgi:hypothetical protein